MEYLIVSWRRASSLRRNENFYSLAVEVYFQAYLDLISYETIGTKDISKKLSYNKNSTRFCGGTSFYIVHIESCEQIFFPGIVLFDSRCFVPFTFLYYFFRCSIRLTNIF